MYKHRFIAIIGRGRLMRCDKKDVDFARFGRTRH